MKLSGYPAYIHSGNEWVGSIPEHWTFLRADFATTSPKLQVSQEEMEGREVFYYSIPNVQEYGTAQVEDGTEIDSAKLRITITQLLVSKLNPRKATLCIAQPHPELLTVCSGEFISIVPESELDLKYCYYAWLSDKVTKLLSSRVQSVTRSHQRVEPEEITKLYWAWPPIEEQHQIAAFLDWKTGQIDALIAKKRQLLERLKEKRTAAITQAVTKGVQPKVPLKDSGIAWLGHVPKHWQVMRFGYRTRVQEGQVDPEDEVYADLPMIAPNHIESGTGRVSGVTSARDQAAISGKYIVRKGDLVYSKIRPHLNKCALADFDGLCSADMYPIRTELELTSEFLLYWMLAQPFLDYATLSSMRVAMPKLNRETLSAAPLIVPPEAEQKAIVNYLNESTSSIDRLLRKVEAALERLIEYRAALITSATTGKIDVRTVQLGPTA